MKIAYRIVTPILALASIALGIFLKMFYFVIGSTDEQIGSLVSAISQLSNGSFSTTYEYSVFELLKMIITADPEAAAAEGEEVKTFAEIAEAIMPELYAFFIVFAIAILVCLAIAIVSAVLADSKKKRKSIIGLSVSGLVLLFVCIIISNSAFNKIIAGQVNLTDLISLFSDSVLATLATAILSITDATLSAGFYAMFGIFMFIIIWTIVAGMIIKTPIQKTKKAYKRKKPMKSLSAVFHR